MIAPERGLMLGLGATEYFIFCVPLPLAPDVIVMNALRLVDDQLHPRGAETFTDAVPPEAVNDMLAGVIPVTHELPA
jgi:hypothetical protein